jgi:target of rapamycin complex subunit LST8
MTSEEGCEPSESVILATGGYDHTIKLWQAHTGTCQRTLQHTESVIRQFLFLKY